MHSKMKRSFFIVVLILTCVIPSADSEANQHHGKEKQNKALSPLADDWGRLHVFIQV